MWINWLPNNEVEIRQSASVVVLREEDQRKLLEYLEKECNPND